MTPDNPRPNQYVHWIESKQAWHVVTPTGETTRKNLDEALALGRAMELYRKEHPPGRPKNPRAEDDARCRSCEWGGVMGKGGQSCCLYSEHHEHSRLWLHYQRTGEQNPKTLPHGVGCLEYEKKQRGEKNSRRNAPHFA